jgi:GntR family transcriptional repressor for pyruvate dehydrogenase complex
MRRDSFPYAILQQIVDEERKSQGEEIKLPPMDELADRLGVSRGKLREELIAAQAYGLVEMRPGDGTYICPFDFYTAVRTLLQYSLTLDRKNFDRFYEVRVELESAFWERAVRALDGEDHKKLRRILEHARQKLNASPVEIPHAEHRDFHLLIYSRLDNEFARGLMRAYWDAYETVGLNRYFDLSYFEKMWRSHEEMVETIESGDLAKGREILVHHFTLLQDRLRGK